MKTLGLMLVFLFVSGCGGIVPTAVNVEPPETNIEEKHEIIQPPAMKRKVIQSWKIQRGGKGVILVPANLVDEGK